MARHRRRLHRLFRTAFVLALALTLLFGIRTVLSAIHWNDPENIDAPMQGWMPLGYVARSWDVPREVLMQALDFGPDERPRSSLRQIAEDRGVPIEALIDEVQAAIAAHREARDD